MINIFQRNKKSRAKADSRKTKGHLDGYDGSILRGWACSKTDPEPLNLVLYVNDREHLSFISNEFRPDLKDANILNGTAAFTEELDVQRIMNEFGNDSVLRVKDRATGEELKNSPIILKKPELKWFVDLYSDDEFVGWVVDVNNESLQIKINVYVNGEQVGDIAANLERADLSNLGVENCHHGFHLNFSRFSKGKELFKIKFEIEYGDTLIVGKEKEVFSFQSKLKELTELQHYLREQNYGDNCEEKNRLVKAILPGLIDACREQRHVPVAEIIYVNEVEVKSEIAIIIPVYKGVQETLNCLNSVLNSDNNQAYRLIVINDCGPEEEMQPALEALASEFCVELLYNEDNLGFVGTVNKGMKLAVGHDVILLNSDTVVADGWLDAIASVAASSATIGTVTPLSNNATICSYPNFCLDNELPSGYDVNQIAALCKDNAEAPVELPTAHGYCMFIKRVVLNEVGYFDEQKWGKGYAEENDFSLRSSKLGWKHVATNKTFVHHLGSVSFAEDTEGFIAKNLDKLNAMYPDYPMLVQQFIRKDPVRNLRKELGKNLLKDEISNNQVLLPAKGKSMLFVSLTIGGGTKVATDNLAKLLHEEGQSVFMLTTKDNLIWEISSHITNATAQFDIASEYDEFISFLKELDIWHINYHHVLEFGKNVWDISSELDCEYDVTVHDYFSICPRVNLLTENDAFCGEPAEKGCSECLGKMGVHDSSFLQLNDLGGTIKEWRGYFFEKLAGARKVITPSKDTKSRMEKYLPLKNIEALYHPETVEIIKFETNPKSESINIGFIGAIGPHKGLQVIKNLASEIASSNSDAKITIIGYTSDDGYFDRYDFVKITGPYKKKDLKDVMLGAEIDVIFLASIWPETFSYTYSEVVRFGYPIVSFNYGAVVERSVDNSSVLLVDFAIETSYLEIIGLFLSDIRTTDFMTVGERYNSIFSDYYGFSNVCR